jgi:TetR/AcrR family transcriptional regulator, ethionamide resistance regulator
MERQGRPHRSRAVAPASPGRPRGTLILEALERLLSHAPMGSLDVEAIAVEAGITRTRFYAYYASKNDALAALLRRMIDVRNAAYQHPDSWFVGRGPGVRPRDSVRRTIEMAIDVAWPHRFVLREACDLWTAAPEVRDAWLDVINAAAGYHEVAIIRERERGVAPRGCDARHTAEALAWQAERLCFRAWAQLPGAMSANELGEVCLEAYMRMIFLADDPDPERTPLPNLATRAHRPHTRRKAAR